MFPRAKRIKNEHLDKVCLKYYDIKQTITIDKTKCIGCGICTKVCPNQVILSRQPLDGKIRVNINDLIPYIPKPLECSFCGTCAYMCPVSAITLEKDDQVQKKNEFGIIIKKVVPQLDFKDVDILKPRITFKSYIEGEIDVNWDKCISCMSCVEVCPTESFSRQRGQKKPSFNSENCVSCGACERACSQNAIELNIKNIKYKGKYKEIFWTPLLNRLMDNFKN
jgi:ferredoxin